MKITNLKSTSGNPVANQFIIEGDTLGNGCKDQWLQSYDSIIVYIDNYVGGTHLDEKYWNYSRTTSKYRNIFLGENTKETQAKIDSGEYTLTNLNEGA